VQLKHSHLSCSRIKQVWLLTASAMSKCIFGRKEGKFEYFTYL